MGNTLLTTTPIVWTSTKCSTEGDCSELYQLLSEKQTCKSLCYVFVRQLVIMMTEWQEEIDLDDLDDRDDLDVLDLNDFEGSSQTINHMVRFAA